MARAKTVASPPEPDAPKRPSYTVEELAGLLRIADRSVRRYIEDGRIRAIKVGKWVRIPAEEVDRLMEHGV
jgi:excisionase family DNA binding protein